VIGPKGAYCTNAAKSVETQKGSYPVLSRISTEAANLKFHGASLAGERKEGLRRHGDIELQIVDLPGTHSLTV